MIDSVNLRNLLAGLVLCLAMLIVGTGCGDHLAEVGGTCRYHADCDERCVGGNDFPGGMCTITCDDDYDCPNDTFCVDRKDGVCLPGCGRDSECRRDYECLDVRNYGRSGDSAVCIAD